MQVTPVIRASPSCKFTQHFTAFLCVRVGILSCSLNLVNSVVHQNVTGTASSGGTWSQILKRQGTESSLISAVTQFLSRLSEHLKGEIYAPAAELYGLPERGENLNGLHAHSHDVCSPSTL